MKRWSGEDVLAHSMGPHNVERADRAIEMLNRIRVWPKSKGYSCLRNWLRFKRVIKNLCTNSYFENFMTLCVLMNIVVLIFDSSNF